MAWKRQRIREICIGMEINGYLPAEIGPPSRLQLYCDCNGKPTPHTSPLMLPMAQPDKQQE